MEEDSAWLENTVQEEIVLDGFLRRSRFPQRRSRPRIRSDGAAHVPRNLTRTFG